ncbi:UNVERIFIED_CONTAM: hypothetical protein FKN15_015296 [Acipenser sinensis]
MGAGPEARGRSPSGLLLLLLGCVRLAPLLRVLPSAAEGRLRGYCLLGPGGAALGLHRCCPWCWVCVGRLPRTASPLQHLFHGWPEGVAGGDGRVEQGRFVPVREPGLGEPKLTSRNHKGSQVTCDSLATVPSYAEQLVIHQLQLINMRRSLGRQVLQQLRLVHSQQTSGVC